MMGEAKKNFEALPLNYSDPILGIAQRYRDDPRNPKIDCSLGVIPGHTLDKVWKPPVVERLLEVIHSKYHQSYLPILGHSGFREGVKNYLGSPLTVIQTLGSTGALFLAFEFYRSYFHSNIVVVSTPSWPNYGQIASKNGLAFKEVPYLNQDLRPNIKLYLEEIDSLLSQGKKVIGVIQIACHNPTGIDLSLEDLREISSFFKLNFPNAALVLDHAYDGFVPFSECKERLNTIEAPHFCCYSFSKNFGLYSLRTGALCVNFGKEFSDETLRLENAFKIKIRGEYSTPPALGAEIVAQVISASVNEWMEQVDNKRLEIEKMRQTFVNFLPKEFTFLLNQRGMFLYIPGSYLNRPSHDVQENLIEENAIYTVAIGKDLRINISSLKTEEEVERVATAVRQYLI